MVGNGTTSRTKAWLAVLGIFVAGFIAGTLAMNLYQRNQPGREGQRDRHRDPVELMKAQLHLTADQEQQVRSILKETFEEYGKIREDVHPRFDAERQKSRERIRAVLTPEQLPKYEEMIKEADARRERMEKQGGPPGWRGKPDGPRDRGESEKRGDGQDKTGDKKADEKSN